jgi:hypothetical protein
MADRKNGVIDTGSVTEFFRQRAIECLGELVFRGARYMLREVGEVSLQHFGAQLLEPGRIVGCRRSVASRWYPSPLRAIWPGPGSPRYTWHPEQHWEGVLEIAPLNFRRAFADLGDPMT